MESQVLTIVLVAASCFLAAGGGLGGGALLVPIYLVVAKLEAHQAIGLSNFTICCGALASFFINVWRKHPTRPGATMINWGLVMMLEPLTVLGAMVGGYVNKVQPPWLTTILLGVLLCIMAGLLARKWWSQTLSERHARESRQRSTGTSIHHAHNHHILHPHVRNRAGDGARVQRVVHRRQG